jgi:hypothetical protein
VTFEHVALSSEEDATKQSPQRNRGGLFAIFATTQSDEPPPPSEDARGMGIRSGSSFQIFGSRKRGQSGQGAELKSMGGGAIPALVV